MASTLHWEVRNYMKELRHGRLQVLLSLILHSNIRGRSWPKTETIMAECGYNDKTIITQAKDWLFEHKAFVYVPFDKRVGTESLLHNRHQVYQLTGFIEINGEKKPYLFVNPETEEEMTAAVKDVLTPDIESQSSETLLRDSLSSESLPHKVVQEESKDSPKNKEKDIAATPRKQTDADLLAQAFGVEAKGKSFSMWGGLAKELKANGILSDEYPAYIQWIRNLAKSQGNWDVTPHSLTNNGRPSLFVKQKKEIPAPAETPILKASIKLSPEDEQIRRQNEIALEKKRAEYATFKALIAAEQAERGD